jgi:predicted DNA-binding transcriptional regulator AlpA
VSKDNHQNHSINVPHHTKNVKHAEPDRLLKQSDVGEFLSMSPTTLEQWRLKGKGPRWVRIGRSVRYPLSELQNFIDELKPYGSTSEADNEE